MKELRSYLNLILSGILIGLILTAWRPPAPAVALTQTQGDETCNTSRSVNVSGAAVIYTAPDRALLQMGVQTNGATPDAVQAENFTAIQSVKEAIRSQGVEAKDIATDYYVVYPVYEDYNALEIKGYRINNTVSVTLKDVNLVEEVIIAALKAGANEVQDVQFYTSQLRQVRDQAREQAVKAAGEKASALAGSAGAETGCVISINENTWTQYYGSWRGGREMALWAQNTIQNAAQNQEGQLTLDDSPISLGQIAIRAEVNVSYALK